MTKSEIERMTHYYYGVSHIKQISISELEKISNENNIKSIYEIYEDGYIGNWYYVIKKVGSSVVVNYGCNNETIKKKIEPYMKKHNGKRINAEELKLYRKNIYPAIHKVDRDYFFAHCSINEKRNNSEYDYLYTETSKGYIGIGQYNNIFYSANCDNEALLIKKILSINELSKNISDNMLFKHVIDDRHEKNFEMII